MRDRDVDVTHEFSPDENGQAREMISWRSGLRCEAIKTEYQIFRSSIDVSSYSLFLPDFAMLNVLSGHVR